MDVKLAEESFQYNNEELWFEILLKVGYIESVNYMHGYNPKTKTKYLLDTVVRMKSKIKEQIAKVDPIKYCKIWLNSSSKYRVDYQFIMKKSVDRRDLDNCIKLTQDAIFESLNINDARVYQITATKRPKPAAKNEYIVVKLSGIN